MKEYVSVFTASFKYSLKFHKHEGQTIQPHLEQWHFLWCVGLIMKMASVQAHRNNICDNSILRIANFTPRIIQNVLVIVCSFLWTPFFCGYGKQQKSPWYNTRMSQQPLVSIQVNIESTIIQKEISLRSKMAGGNFEVVIMNQKSLFCKKS